MPRWATALNFVIPRGCDFFGIASPSTKAGCPIQARFWLEWDTTVLSLWLFHPLAKSSWKAQPSFVIPERSREPALSDLSRRAVEVEGDLRCALPSSNSLQLRPSISILAWVDMDGRKHCHSTNPISLVYVLFHAFSKLRRPEGRLRANLDSSG